MGMSHDDNWENFSVIGEETKVGFLDFEDEKSISDFSSINEGPVIISSPFPFVKGKPQSARVGETRIDVITLDNTTPEPMDIWGVRIYSSNPEDSFHLSLTQPPSDECDVDSLGSFLAVSSLEDRVLQAKQKIKIWLLCKPKEIGLHTSILHFDVGDDNIERRVYLLAEDKISWSLASSRPYQLRPRRNVSPCETYVKGPRITKPGSRKPLYYLPRYPVPAEIRELIKENKVPNCVMEGLTEDNYTKYFTNLLIMEEIHLEEDVRQHDMDNVSLKSRGKFLTLEVPGLAEKRPSLVAGDFIFAKTTEESFQKDAKIYQGCIHRVEADEILLVFGEEFYGQHRGHATYTVMFAFNRLNARRCYQAVEVATKSLSIEFLFPTRSRKIKKHPFVPLNQRLNEEQMAAVQMILGCKGAPPYVIHGPPGTGKTVTMVEAVLQLYFTRKGRYGARILVCAASNSAADHILERLLKMSSGSIEKHEIFRLNAPSRAYEEVEAEILSYCYYDEMIFKCPPLKALLHYKIIISTYMSASLIYAEGIRRGHFTHIFLDEAGQASEPEAMVPVANLCRPETVVVLAGDPLQLGPVIHSKEAGKYGLGKSYMERLFDSEFYSCGEDYAITLVKNYRSHEAILKLPSEIFYKGGLMACREDKDTSLCEWVELPQKNFPVLFVGIQGCDEREGCNPSWFNRFEVSKVVEIILRLRVTAGVLDGEIGVITPYRQQVMKMRKALEALGTEGVKVGSVEQFQGQEKRVIIISTVRSTVKHNDFDNRFNLGFLSNPRRFNVAVTRARSLLIIVGNPHIISKDPYWDKFLRYCSDSSSYQGCPLPPPEHHDFPIDVIDTMNSWDDYEANRQGSNSNCDMESIKIWGTEHVSEEGDWDKSSWISEKTVDESDVGSQCEIKHVDRKYIDNHMPYPAVLKDEETIEYGDDKSVSRTYEDASSCDDGKSIELDCYESSYGSGNLAGKLSSHEYAHRIEASSGAVKCSGQIMPRARYRGKSPCKMQNSRSVANAAKSSKCFGATESGGCLSIHQKFPDAENWDETFLKNLGENSSEAQKLDVISNLNGHSQSSKRIPDIQDRRSNSCRSGRATTSIRDAGRSNKGFSRGKRIPQTSGNNENLGKDNDFNERCVKGGQSCDWNTESSTVFAKSGRDLDCDVTVSPELPEPCFDESQWSDGWA